MAVPVQTPFVEYIANGVTTNFPLGFDCETQSHLIVTVDGIEPITGSWSLLVGAVVFNSAPITGSKIIIKRNSPFERDRDFQLYDQSFRPPAVNLDLDRIWRKLQELGVMDWLLGNRIDALKSHVDSQDAQLQQNIDNLKNYVDDKDDELRAYLLEEIRKQGVALDQLEDYYNYLMQRLAEIAVNGGWESSFVSYGSINQKKYNDGVESIAELLEIQNPFDGMRVYVKSYHAGLNKGGGTFVYNSEKSLINDGVVCFNGWVRASFLFITSSMAGCKIDGVTDDTAALQRGVDYTAQNGFSLYLDDGVHYLNTATFKRWGTEHNYQTYCPIIEIKYSNTSVIAKDYESVLKYGDGVTYTGWSEIGYVGAQLFSANPTVQIDNFELIGVSVDGNGYNNKIRGLNGGGTSAGNQAVALQKGNNTRIVGNRFKNLSGYQALFIAYDTQNTIVEQNEFIDTGWLDGTNWTENYTDQSTVYLGGTYICRNNKVIQSFKGMFAGTAFEQHGKGSTFSNYVENYACAFLSASVVHSADNKFIGNTVINSTMLLATDTQNNLNNHVTASGNYFMQNTQKNPQGSVYDLYRSAFYIFAAYSPNKCSIEITGNTIETDGLYSGSTDEYLKTNNSIIAAQEVDSITFSNNVINNHKGHFLRLLNQKANSKYVVSNNTFDGCGVDNSTDLGNSIVYYDNNNNQSWGFRPSAINIANNTFKECRYGQYFGGALDVLEKIITPYSLVIDNDVHDTWITTLRVKPTFDVPDDFYNEYNYKVNSTYNAAKDINRYNGEGYNGASQRGEIKFLENGVSKSYKKTNTVYAWSKKNNGELELSATYDPASIAPNTQIEYIFNDVIGATLGMSATPTFDKFLSGVQMWAQVTANQQVVVYFRNGTAASVDIPSGTLTVKLI